MSVQIPSGYNPDGLAPVIYIYDHNLQLHYTYQHPQITDPPQQDFILSEWQISTGINSDAGHARIRIEDHDANLTDSVGDIIIKAGWHIQILLGKDANGLESWFFGVCNEPMLERPQFGLQYIDVSAYGYAHTLTSRFVSISHAQERDSETAQLDETDTSACVSELVKLLFSDQSLLLPPADPNLTLNGVDDVDIKMANLDKTNQSQSIVLSELANLANCVYGITPDLDLYFHSATQHSGFIITNGDTSQIDPDKLMIIRNKPFVYKETIVRKAFTSLIGLDLTLKLDLLKDKGGSAEYHLRVSNSDHYGFEINHFGTINELGLYLLRNRTLQYDLPWEIKSYYGTNDPNYDDGTQETQGTLSKDALNNTNTGLTVNTADWITLNPRLDAVPGATRRLLWFTPHTSFGGLYALYKPGNTNEIFGSNGYDFDRNDSSNYDSSDSGNSGIPRMRILGEPQQTLLKAQNLKVQKQQQHKEQMQYMQGTPESETAEALTTGLLDQAGQRRRIYQFTASVPNTRPVMGKQIRVIDTHNGLDTNALLIGMDIEGGRQGKLTAIDITLELERYL